MEVKRTVRGLTQAHDRAIELPSGLNRILELTEHPVSMEDLFRHFPQTAPAKLQRAVDYLVQEGFLETAGEAGFAARANYLAPPLIEVEELDPQAGVFAWAEARRGAKALKDRGFYAHATLAAAPAHVPTVLLVEDDDPIAELAGLLLTEEGLQVSRVRDAEQALEVLAGAKLPDLVLLDVMLAKMTGFELLDHIRADPVLGKLPVIMVTSQASDEDVLRGLRGGADGYIFKPFDADLLVDGVKKVLGLPTA